MAPKTVLITGCSVGGMGAALATEFHRLGWTVFAGARTPSKAAPLAEMGITVLEMDVTSDASVTAAVETVSRATSGRLDMLINNAGVEHIMPFTDTPLSELKRVLDTNIYAVMAVTQAFMPLVMEARGVIANMGSVTPQFVPPYQTAYVASKAAISAFSDTLRIEVKPFGVRVVLLVPGAIGTHLFDNAAAGHSKLPEGSLYAPLRERIESHEFLGKRFTPPDEFARAVVKDLVKPSPPLSIWNGIYTTTAWFIEKFGWRGILDNAYQKRLGLNTLKPRST